MPGITKESKKQARLFKGWSNEECFSFMRRIQSKFGGIPPVNDFYKVTGYYSGVFRKRFGSWVQLLKLSGCIPLKKIKKDPYPKKFLLSHLLNIYDDLGKTPQVKEFDTYGISNWIPRERFGTWNAYLKAAGLKIYRFRSTPGKDFIKKEMLVLISRLGYVPTYKEITSVSFRKENGLEIGMGVIISEFKTYRNLLESINKPVNGVGGKMKRLRYILTKLYGEVLCEHTFGKKLRNPKTNRLLPCDFYIPSLNMIVEYDDESHFDWTYYLQFSKSKATSILAFEKRKELDSIRDKFADKNEIFILRIPYNEDLSTINVRRLVCQNKNQ